MPLHARGNVEGTSGRVHASAQLRVKNVLHHDLLLVEPAAVVNVLGHNLNGALGVILVLLGHVHVVHEVD